MYSDVFIGDPSDQRFYGIYRGIVSDTNDPSAQNRIKLKVPQILGNAETSWAWPIVSTSPSTPGTGVWVMFEGGDPNFPLWIGAF